MERLFSVACSRRGHFKKFMEKNRIRRLLKLMQNLKSMQSFLIVYIFPEIFVSPHMDVFQFFCFFFFGGGAGVAKMDLPSNSTFHNFFDVLWK